MDGLSYDVKTAEFDRLQQLLDKKGIEYVRIDDQVDLGPYGFFWYHQLRKNKGMKMVWSVVCHTFSYGSGEGLLEFYTGKGEPEGWLTAEEALKRIKKVTR